MNSRPIFTERAPQPIGPYSQAVECGDLLFLSGQIPLDPKTGQVSGSDITEQTRQALQNVKAILSAQNLSTASLVKTTVYIRDIQLFAEFNRVYEEELGGAKPARSVVEVSGLPKNVLVEVEAIACR